MIQVTVQNNTSRKTITTETTSTIKDAIAQAGMEIGRATVNINGRILKDNELNNTFASFAVQDGSTTSLGVIVKGDGASI